MPNTERRPPPAVPGGNVPSPAQVWSELRKLWTYVRANHLGIPGGFFSVEPNELGANSSADAGSETAGWAAADHDHPVHTAAPSNPTGTAASEGTDDALMRADATIMQGIVTTKGDVLTYSTVPARLAVGNNDEVLTAASGQTTGLIWRTIASLIASVLTAKGDLLTHNGTAAVRKAVGTNGQTIIADSTVAEGWKWSSLSMVWTKYTATHTALQAAAMANDIELLSLPAGGIIHGVKIKHSVLFAGTGITDYKVSVGIVGTLAKYASAFDVDTAVSNTNFQLSTTIGSENHGAATSIRLAATTTGANLDQSTGGSVDVWVLTSVAV